MDVAVSFPKIVALTQRFGECQYDLDHIDLTKKLQELLSGHLVGYSFEDFFLKELPLVVHSDLQPPPFHLRLYLLCKKRSHVGRFFMEMVGRWLVPGKLLPSSFCFMRDFKFEEGGETTYTFIEMQVPIERKWDAEVVLRHLDLLIQEIKLGVSSTYHGYRVLEMRGLSGHEKIGIIQEEITRFLERFPQRFDYDIFTLMQHCFLVAGEEFKRMRECHHLIRVIASLYLLRKELLLRVEAHPQKRHISLVLKSAQLNLPLGTKYVLTVCVGLNFLREHEIFAKRHLIRAIQTCLPYSRAIEESYLEIEEPTCSVHLLYLEIEKEDKESFTLQEIQQLKQELPYNLKGRIEYLLRPIFMPRNEEEVMRNIILLSHQLKYVKDLPQVVIAFDEQTDKQLVFTVILTRVVSDQSFLASVLLKKMSDNYEPIIERERQVGVIRNKYVKQALVIRMKLPSSPFLREDDSVDLYVARREVLSEIQKAFGEVRDFNGGMISKQSEAFLALKKMLGSVAHQHKLLLENFFHSIYPIECRSVLNPRFLTKLFAMLLAPAKQQNKWCGLSFDSEEGCDLALIDFYEIGCKQKVLDAIHPLGILSRKLVQIHLQTVDGIHLGFIYLEHDDEKKRLFFETLKGALDF